MKYLMALVLIVGCKSTIQVEKRAQVRVPMARCVLECVHSKTYHFDKIDGPALAEMTKLCEAALVGQECCASRFVHDYYSTLCE